MDIFNYLSGHSTETTPFCETAMPAQTLAN